jgi:hypothetical protein
VTILPARSRNFNGVKKAGCVKLAQASSQVFRVERRSLGLG